MKSPFAAVISVSTVSEGREKITTLRRPKSRPTRKQLKGGMTNCRSQVQLKATNAIQANHGGSISFSVATANLNYLLNGVVFIYLLYYAQTGQF
jgi:hypothetical protein